MARCKADVCLGDGVGLVTEVSKEIAKAADATVILSKNGAEIKRWQKHYRELDKPLLAAVASKRECPASGERWDQRTKTGVACGLDREAYKSGRLFPGPTAVGVAQEIEERYKLKPRPGVLCEDFRKILK